MALRDKLTEAEIAELKAEILAELEPEIEYSNKKYPVPFLGKKLFLERADRANPLVLFIIAMIEQRELDRQDGFELLRRLKDNYKVSFNDPSLFSQLELHLFFDK